MAVLTVAASLLSSACSNNVLPMFKSATSGFNKTATGVIGTPGLVSITNVLRDNQDPFGTFDIIGDNSFAMGTYCLGTDGSSAGTGASSCKCNFTYTIPGVNGGVDTEESTDVDTSYHEGNLLRCPYHDIPSSVASVDVRVKVTSQSNNVSDPFSFNFQNNGGLLDTAAIQTYAQVYRYTCRDIVTITDFMDTAPNGSGIYDPFQSEDPRISYPLNFYTTNLGFTLNAYAGGVSGIAAPTFWDCPANPLQPPPANQLTIYSETALNGSKIISPGSNMNGFNARSTFYLAKAKTGVFNVAVDSYIAPQIHTNAPDSQGNSQGVPPIGYGASPISTGVSGQERCPDSSVAIPPGFTWVKVWLFKMNLPARQYMSSNKFYQLGNISCNPGKYPNNPNYSASYFDLPFNDCDGAISLDTKTDGQLVGRFFEQTRMCVKPTAGGTTNGVGALIAPYSSYNPHNGTDVWTPNNGYPGFACSTAGVANPARLDPTNVCGSTPANMGIDTAPNKTNFPGEPNRYDYIFVVTPPTVMSSDMGNGSSSAIYTQYAPYRFRADADCGAADPDTAGCNPANAFTTYGIKFHDVGTAGDPPASDPNRPGVFPVCALQPTS